MNSDQHACNASLAETSGTIPSGLTLVQARHPHWAGQLRLDHSSKRLVLTINGSTGAFALEGDDLVIYWDAFGAERFRRVGTAFIHTDLLPSLVDSATASTPAPLRIAIVTGYYKEPRVLLERCLRSVRQQTVPADHIVVADGFPQDWIDEIGVRHIRLDKSHGDYGNTPRGIGSLLAIAESYDAISFLDADNWLEPNHLERGVETARCASVQCDYVIARWNLRRPDETIMPLEGEPIDQHVDTNCFLFFAGAFHAIMNFALMPQQLSAIGDRIFYTYLRGQNLQSAIIPEKTVNYHCLWESLYRAIGEEPPPDAKPNIDQTPIQQWLQGLSPQQRIFLSRRTGLTFG